jgi:hypothetical protein
MPKKKPPVQPRVNTSSQPIRFSFEFYDMDGEEFCISAWNTDEIKAALGRLKDINTKSFNEMINQRTVYHFGEVVWEKTIKKDGFPDQRANELAAFHFALLGVNNQKARVYGAYYEGTFYIIWFDLDHLIWPSPLRNT